MENRSRKQRQMLLSAPKPIKHNLLENFYTENGPSTDERSHPAPIGHAWEPTPTRLRQRNEKKPNSYKKWSLLTIPLMLLLIIPIWFVFSPTQQAGGQRADSKVQADTAMTEAEHTEEVPESDFSELPEEETVEEPEPVPVTETKEERPTTETKPSETPKETPKESPNHSSNESSTVSKPADDKGSSSPPSQSQPSNPSSEDPKPQDPDNPPPPTDDQPKEPEKPKCKPSIWNLFMCRD